MNNANKMGSRRVADPILERYTRAADQARLARAGMARYIGRPLAGRPFLMEKTHMKWKLTWTDKLFTLLMQQQVTEENLSYASVAVGAWLGEKASTMSEEDFEKLLEQAVEELETRALETRAEHRACVEA